MIKINALIYFYIYKLKEKFLPVCDCCKNYKFYVAQRTYKVPANVSSKPITSNGKLCGKCYRGIKKNVINKI